MARYTHGPRYQRMLDEFDVIEPTKAERKAARQSAYALEMALQYCDAACHGKGCAVCNRWEREMREALEHAFYEDRVDDPMD